MADPKTSRVCVVTGARGNLGAAVVEAAALAGWSVAALDRSAGAKDANAALSVVGDLGSAEAAEKAIKEVADKFGRIDALFNIAGGFAAAGIGDAKPELWLEMFTRNCLSAVNASRAALPWLRKSEAGRIVNVGAAGALKAGKGMGPYAASKSAVHRFTESLAAELKDTAMTVNAILPTTIDTPQNRAGMPSADFSKWLTPQALAEEMLRLASPSAGAISGTLVQMPKG